MGLSILLKTVGIMDCGIWDKFCIELSKYLQSDWRIRKTIGTIGYRIQNYQIKDIVTFGCPAQQIRPKYEGTLTPSACIYEVELHFELHLHIKGTATPAGTATPTSDSTSLMRFTAILRDRATPTRYSCTCEVQFNLRGSDVPMWYSHTRGS